MSESNYHTTEHFSEKLLAIKINKTNVKMNKLVCLGLPVLDMSKIAMYGFWYDSETYKYEANR